MHCEQTWHAGAALVLMAHEMARTFRRDHKHTYVFRWFDEAVVNGKAVRESQVFSRRHGFSHVAGVNICRKLVRYEHHHDVGFRRSLCHR